MCRINEGFYVQLKTNNFGLPERFKVMGKSVFVCSPQVIFLTINVLSEQEKTPPVSSEGDKTEELKEALLEQNLSFFHLLRMLQVV